MHGTAQVSASVCPVETAFASAIGRLTPSGVRRIGVAVSGGGDSMALLALAVNWIRGRRNGRGASPETPLVVTVDHGLRAESSAEARGVASFCVAQALRHETVRLDPELLRGRGNLSANARQGRYAAISDWAKRHGLDVVLLGHTRDDQAETILMHLARGSGVDGLAGINETLDRDGVRFARPLLDISRRDLRCWLTDRRIDWIDDPTNDDESFDRVKVRQALTILSPLGIDPERLASTSRIVRRQRDALRMAAAALDRSSRSIGPLGDYRFELKLLLAAPLDIRLRVLADALRTLGGARYRPRLDTLEGTLEAVLDQPKGRTLAGCIVLADRDGSTLSVFREPARLPARRPLKASMVWDRRWQVTLAGPASTDGLYVAALGKAGVVHLNGAVNQRVWVPDANWIAAPALLRAGLPAIFLRGETRRPVAVPTVDWVANDAQIGAEIVRIDHLSVSDTLDASLTDG
ncbi:MAG: tRNA lysidine(34) synthetase TilS [Pseudomonadota bacterium]